MNLPATGWLLIARHDGEAPCPIPGCEGRSARWNVRLAEELRPLCARCRQDVHTHRARHPELFADEAVAAVADVARRRTLARATACAVPGCSAHAGRFNAGTAPELRALCPAHRQCARLLLAKRRATRATVLARLTSTRAPRAAAHPEAA